jgi:hypothetical protein
VGSTQNQGISRRAVVGSSVALGVGLASTAATSAVAAPTGSAEVERAGAGPSPRGLLGFLQGVTDAFSTSGPRLAQSYFDGAFPKDFGGSDIGFVYDQALTILALVASRDLARAKAIADALIYAQDHDETYHDGRLRQAYHVDTFVNPNGTAHFAYEFGLVGTAVGDMAWPGIALAQLAKASKEKKYLDAAVRIADWIVTFTYSTTGLGGYTFGETAGLQDHKSTEHNIDVYAFFRMLGALTGPKDWYAKADHAWAFVEKEWNADAKFFWTGSDDGAAINKNPLQLPLDVQTWSWLAARKRTYGKALDWANGNLASTDTPLRANSNLTGNQRITAAVFASGSLLTDPTKNIGDGQYNPKPDPAAVWFEGTGQLALAFRDRDGHSRCAEPLLGALAWAQRHLGKGQTFNAKRIEGGIVAASSNLDTGFKFGYYPHLHVCASSWALLACRNKNPYQLF